jgi:hypothetical protein
MSGPLASDEEDLHAEQTSGGVTETSAAIREGVALNDGELSLVRCPSDPLPPVRAPDDPPCT